MNKWQSAALVLFCGGISLAGCGSAAVHFSETQYGEENMERKILVAYASRAGSTAEVADRIGRVLAQDHVRVEVRNIKNITAIDGYDAVVMGSGIRAGSVLPETLAFLKKFQTPLQNKPVAYFLVCLTMKDDTPENRKIADAYLDPWRKLVKARDTGLFAGKLDGKQLDFFARLIMKVIKEKENDYRDWQAIESWAKALAEKLR